MNRLSKSNLSYMGIPIICHCNPVHGLLRDFIGFFFRPSPSRLFFRPSPSRLSPGRNTVFVPLNELRPSPSRLSPGRNTVFVASNELCRVQQHSALGSLNRAWTITQPKKSSLGANKTKGQNNTKNRKQVKETINNTGFIGLEMGLDFVWKNGLVIRTFCEYAVLMSLVHP